MKLVADYRAAGRRHQTTCRPDEFWSTVWCMWWCQTSGDDDWPQAPTDTHLRDTTVPDCTTNDLSMSVASLKSTRRRTGSQCYSCRTGEMCWRRPVRVINLAAVFCTDCSEVWRRWCCITPSCSTLSDRLMLHGRPLSATVEEATIAASQQVLCPAVQVYFTQ